MSKILVIEDDIEFGQGVVDLLEVAQHTLEWVRDGKEGLDRLRLYEYDLAIIDWNIPGLTGVEICTQYRSNGGRMPILMLTGRDAVPDKVRGMDAGADDYLTKPFISEEFLARVRALLRRQPAFDSHVIRSGDLEIDTSNHTAKLAGAEITLLPKEFALLELFMRNKNRVFSLDDLLSKVWSSESDSGEEAVRQCILRLRKKIDANAAQSRIANIKGVGYRFDD